MMVRVFYRSLDEMLRLAQFKQFHGRLVTVPPMGRKGARWKPWYTRMIHCNGYQERQRAKAFRAWQDVAARADD